MRVPFKMIAILFLLTSCGDDGRDGNDDDSCSPGNSETSPCDDTCEERTRVCADDGTWGAWSECETTIECLICTPGDTRREVCGDCSVRTQTCGDDSLWGAWSDCVETAIPEVCDDFDNDCDDQIDEDGVCDACPLAQTGETEALDENALRWLATDGENYALITEGASEGAFTRSMFVFDGTGQQIGNALPLEFPENIDLSPQHSNLIFNGSDYIVFTAVRVESPGGTFGNPDWVDTEIWMTSISPDGTDVDSELISTLPRVADSEYTIDGFFAGYNESSEQMALIMRAFRFNYVEGSGVNWRRIVGLSFASDGTPVGSIQEHFADEAEYMLPLAVVEHNDGFVAALLDSLTGELTLLLTDGAMAERRVTRTELNTEGFQRRQFGSAGETITAVFAEWGSETRMGKILSFDTNGDMTSTVDIPKYADETGALIEGCTVEGGAVIGLVRTSSDLVWVRYDGLAEMIDDPVIVKRFPQDYSVSVNSVQLVASDGGFAMAYTDTQDIESFTRMNVLSPIACDNRCEVDPLCSSGETEDRPCGSDVGECSIGSQRRVCLDGCIWDLWSPCEDGSWPTSESGETCGDGLDNDCNGMTDINDQWCTICDVDPEHWLCSWCGSLAYSEACDCLYGTDFTNAPCDCILAGDDKCNCELDSSPSYCQRT